MSLMSEINFPKLTDAEVKQMTGKTWSEWCDELNGWGAKPKSLTAIAIYLIEQHHLRRLLAQMIAVYYKWECLQGKH
jgi:hypothetical protein